MNAQMSLSIFDSKPRFPRARRSDVRSSHEGAALLESTGKGREQANAVLAAIKNWPGSTGRELARATGLNYSMVMRRGCELVKAGLVREAKPHDDTIPCVVTGRKLLRRWPA